MRIKRGSDFGKKPRWKDFECNVGSLDVKEFHFGLLIDVRLGCIMQGAEGRKTHVVQKADPKTN